MNSSSIDEASEFMTIMVELIDTASQFNEDSLEELGKKFDLDEIVNAESCRAARLLETRFDEFWSRRGSIGD